MLHLLLPFPGVLLFSTCYFRCMKKLAALFALTCLSASLLSWDSLGHHVIGEIAERHLTPAAKAAIKDLLGHQGLANVSAWADDIKSADRATASWHYIDVPLGLSFADFQKEAENQSGVNVYKAIIASVNTLKNPHITQRHKVEALKFLVHFVGDIHQPMHVSRPDDKGGNSINVTYNGDPTNLHAVWDGKLLDEDGASYRKLADKYDTATPEQIKRWQSDPVIIWAWESYQVSTILYKEVEGQNGTVMGKAYFDAHIPVVKRCIEKAGIRLAGMLNQVFADNSATAK